MDGTLPNAGSEQYSLTRLVLDADPVVQAVMLGLLLASIVCWAVIFEKIIQLGRLNRDVHKLERLARSESAEGDSRAVRNLLAAAQEELSAPQDESRNETQMRLERAMRSAAKTELRRYEIGLPFLATVGSAAPFIGLFGTVWGIMNSFTSIAQAKDTSLAVVAPGIAEALFATGLGLAAAIPAVIAYNQISVSLGRSAARIGSAVTALAKQFAFGQRGAKPGVLR
jgi:biopolymer transport protein ExbB/TolQ